MNTSRLILTSLVAALLWAVPGCGDTGSTNIGVLPPTASAGDATGSPGDPADASGPTDPVTNPDGTCVQLSIMCDGADAMMCMADGSWQLIQTCEAAEACDPKVTGGCVCLPKCDGKACGDDGCGGVCGECTAGLECTMGGACMEPGSCVPQGTGTTAGSQVANMAWTIQDGSTFNLHDWCGAVAGVILIETAGW